MAISSWGSYDASGIQKESQGAGYSGNNNGYAIYSNGQQGSSYDQVRQAFVASQKAQNPSWFEPPSIDPQGLAVWAVRVGLNPSFGDPRYLKDVFAGNTERSRAFVTPQEMASMGTRAGGVQGVTADQIKANQDAFMSGNLSSLKTPDNVLSYLPQAEAAKIKAVQDFAATQIKAPSQQNQSVQNSSGATSGLSTNNPQTDALIKRVLLEAGHVTDLQSIPFWNSADQATKQAAYAQLQNVFSSPQNLAQYVQDNGITNLQNYQWWSSNPMKQDAWNLISSGQVKPQTSGLNTNQQAGTPAGATQGTASTQAAGATPANSANDAQAIQTAIDSINNSNLDDHTKELYKAAVQNWNPGQEINIPNILKTFSDIKSSTIDPYFQQVISQATDQFSRAQQQLQTNRGLQTESEQVNAQQNIKNTQNDLEARGLTFSGKGVEQLGANSAYAQNGQGPMPNQETFGGKYAEGLVNQGNRLISTASKAQYDQNLTDLSRQAEQQLGSAGSAGLIGGVNQLGGITGSIQQQKQQQEGSTLSGLYSQEQQNVQARQPLNVFSN